MGVCVCVCGGDVSSKQLSVYAPCVCVCVCVWWGCFFQTIVCMCSLHDATASWVYPLEFGVLGHIIRILMLEKKNMQMKKAMIINSRKDEFVQERKIELCFSWPNYERYLLCKIKCQPFLPNQKIWFSSIGRKCVWLEGGLCCYKG